MSIIDIEMMKTLDFDGGAVTCKVCKAEMNPTEIDLKDRLVRLIFGRGATLLHYQCPDCQKELITIEK